MNKVWIVLDVIVTLAIIALLSFSMLFRYVWQTDFFFVCCVYLFVIRGRRAYSKKSQCKESD